MKNNKSGDRSRWYSESHYKRDSNKVTIQKWWIKRKSSGKPEIVSKTYKIIKKIQNEVIQSNMSNMQTAGMKTRSTMDNII